MIFDLITFAFAGLFLYIIFATIVEEWPTSFYIILSIIAITVINIFTLWSTIAIFISINVYLTLDRIKEVRINLEKIITEILPTSAIYTAFLVFTSLLLNLIFEAVLSSSSSSEGGMLCNRVGC